MSEPPGDPALRLRIHLGEADHHGGQPLYTAVVEAARRAGLAGATVFKGIEGYGSHAVVHAARIVDLSADLPVVVELVDSAERVRAFLPTVTAMVAGSLITLEDVRIVGRPSGHAPA